MKKLHEIKKRLCEELDEIAESLENRSLDGRELETLHMLTDTIKNIDKILTLESDGGYSYGGDWEARGRYMPESWRNQPRDARGRYSRGEERDSDMKQILGKLEWMREEVDPKYRDAFQRFIGQLQNT